LPSESTRGENISAVEKEKIRSVYIQTLGCKVNQYESDAVLQSFEKRGFRKAIGDESPDVYLVNTCTVTATADQKSRQMIRRARNKHPFALIIAMGCQVQMSQTGSEADICVGTKDKMTAVDRAIAWLSGSPAKIDSGFVLPGHDPVLSHETARAYIKIEDGCDNYCSYCIIPYARGRVTSRPSDEIIREAYELGKNGFHEIVLTGIHICSYGKDFGFGIGALYDLLQEINRIPEITRIRLGSIEPNSITEQFISDLAAISKLCPHFHISLQSGSDSVLMKMNRKYDTAHYRKVVFWLRNQYPDASITTDIIVGFPTETENEHRESITFCREIQFAKIHVFPFSARQGTKAAEMRPFVPTEVANIRKASFLALSDACGEQFSQKILGKSVSVLVESCDEKNRYSGYTREYVRAYLPYHSEISVGEEIDVIVDSYSCGVLFCK